MSAPHSLRSAAKELGVSHETVRRMCLDGRLPTIELPGVRRRLIPAGAIEALVGTATPEATRNPGTQPGKAS